MSNTRKHEHPTCKTCAHYMPATSALTDEAKMACVSDDAPTGGMFVPGDFYCPHHEGSAQSGAHRSWLKAAKGATPAQEPQCRLCRHWRLAESCLTGDRCMACLNEESPEHGKKTAAGYSCEAFERAAMTEQGLTMHGLTERLREIEAEGFWHATEDELPAEGVEVAGLYVVRRRL